MHIMGGDLSCPNEESNYLWGLKGNDWVKIKHGIAFSKILYFELELSSFVHNCKSMYIPSKKQFLNKYGYSYVHYFVNLDIWV